MAFVVDKSREGIDIQAGGLIHGTLRPQDLAPAFWNELKRIAPLTAARFTDGRYQFSAGELRMETIAEDEDTTELIADLHHELNMRVGDNSNLYFGTTDGDGSEFGWWEALPF